MCTKANSILGSLVRGGWLLGNRKKERAGSFQTCAGVQTLQRCYLNFSATVSVGVASISQMVNTEAKQGYAYTRLPSSGEAWS